MRLDESSLETVKPYHIPGYCGYCPQFKYKINDTFGKSTHELLTSPGISRSKMPVLAPLEGSKGKDCDKIRQILVESRGENLGDQKYGVQMVPGYTGYIPKGQHYYGERYAGFTQNAIAHMEHAQQQYDQQQQKLRNTIRNQYRNEGNTCSPDSSNRFKLPLKPILEKTKMYFPKGKQHSLSPYTYANSDPRKYMMSGYTGFVPCSRGLIGMGYPKYTNKALCDFTTNYIETKTNAKLPIVINRPTKPVENTKPIYYKDSGMVPHYTGHIPGEKFRYGRTFGHSTTNAVPRASLKVN